MSEMFVWYDQTPTVITTTDDATGLTLTTYVHATNLVPPAAAEYVAEAQRKGGPVTVPSAVQEVEIEPAVWDAKGKVIKEAVVEQRASVLPLKEYEAALEAVAERAPEPIQEEVADATQ